MILAAAIMSARTHIQLGVRPQPSTSPMATAGNDAEVEDEFEWPQETDDSPTDPRAGRGSMQGRDLG